MKLKVPHPFFSHEPRVIGTVHSLKSLEEAVHLPQGAVDFLEIRLDRLQPHWVEVRGTIENLAFPLIFTARHPEEGGDNSMDHTARESMLRETLHLASAVDVELRSYPLMQGLLKDAEEAGIATILSIHDFEQTPALPRLQASLARVAETGVTCAKIATRLHNGTDLLVLGSLLTEAGMPLAVMGMGSLGKLSRLLLGGLGSVLNYGFLGEVHVPGQWHAPQLKIRLDEISGN